MTLQTITPQDAHELIARGALLIDIRSADEHARERITQARHIPMSRINDGDLDIGAATTVIFHCRSGNRTRLNARSLVDCAHGCAAYILDGGLDAWKKAGLPIEADFSQPLELQRQVQIAAGSLILLGTLLGAWVSPWFYIVPGFFGAGLIFAGITGFCGLARVLLAMPWNRRAARA